MDDDQHMIDLVSETGEKIKINANVAAASKMIESTISLDPNTNEIYIPECTLTSLKVICEYMNCANEANHNWPDQTEKSIETLLDDDIGKVYQLVNTVALLDIPQLEKYITKRLARLIAETSTEDLAAVLIVKS